jgi:hypothetical protein
MLIYFLILILLSFEASFLLPIFSAYFYWQRIKKFSTYRALIFLFLGAVALSSFYLLPLAMMTSILFLFYFLSRRYKNPLFSSLMFVFIHLYIFLAGDLRFNLFYIVQFLIFAVLLYKKEFGAYVSKKNQ